MAEYFEAGIINVLDKDTDTYHKLLAIKGEKGEKGEKGDSPAGDEIRAQVSAEIAKVIGEAPESFDTLKEIADWIDTHEDSASAMNTAIQTNANDIAELKTKTADSINLNNYQKGHDTTVPTNGSVQDAIGNLNFYIDNVNSVANAALSKEYALPKASADTLGGIKVGTNLSINSDGVLSSTNTTYGAATQSANGLMSSADKTKLDGIAAGANAYSLPTASSSKLGGIKVGTNLSISNGVLSATNTTYSNATQTASGLMSNTDKAKLDGIANGANAYSLPTASSSTLGGVKVGTNLSITNGVLSASYGAATQSANGLMSANDKKKLDGIASGANAYTLPAASAGALGGIKVALSGTTLYISTT